MAELLSHQQEHHQSESTQELFLYKNRLQEFTQRANIPLPVYHTINEGGPRHAPKFKSTVEVDGEMYTSLNVFSNRKAAEQDAAKLALEGISKKIKDCISKRTCEGGFPPIYEDKIFCKSILHEFASKMNIEKPTYNTVRLEGLVPVFVSSLVFDGVKYTGEPSVNKKEAEQLAARAVILSILAKSGIGTLLSEIVKSKAKLLSAVHERSCTDTDTGVSPLGPNSGSDIGTHAIKGRVSDDSIQTGNVSGNVVLLALQGPSASKEGVPEDAYQAGNLIGNAVSKALHGQSPVPLRHEFRKPILQTCSQVVSLPIAFEPPLQVQTPPDGVACGGKRKCRKKKKANKKVKAEIQMQVSDLPLSQVPSSTIAR